MKMVMSLLLKPNVFGSKQKAGPKAGPANKETGGIEGAGFGIYTEGWHVDGGTVF